MIRYFRAAQKYCSRRMLGPAYERSGAVTAIAPHDLASALDEHDRLAPRRAGRDGRREWFWPPGMLRTAHPHQPPG